MHVSAQDCTIGNLFENNTWHWILIESELHECTNIVMGGIHPVAPDDSYKVIGEDCVLLSENNIRINDTCKGL